MPTLPEQARALAMNAAPQAIPDHQITNFGSATPGCTASGSGSAYLPFRFRSSVQGSRACWAGLVDRARTTAAGTAPCALCIWQWGGCLPNPA